MRPEPLNQPSALPRIRRAAAFSRGLYRIPHLDTLLNADSVVFRPSPRSAPANVDAVVGWGHKPSADDARRFARTHGIPYIALEDGFLRSVGLGHESTPLSLVVDDIGIYYDAREPSRLESILQGTGDAEAPDPLADPQLVARARDIRIRLTESEVSKYNSSSTRLPQCVSVGAPWVLVVDQVYGDASVEQGLGSTDGFRHLLEAALDEHPGERVLLKVHPDTVAGKKRGHLYGPRLPDRVTVLADSVNPVALLRHVEHAYVCTSQLGFEALLLGKSVTCFGAPFYSGWGLTHDRVSVSRRTNRRSIDELVAAALLIYPRYLDPVSHSVCDAETVVEHLALQRRRFRENARSFVCVGFSHWKRPFVRSFLSSPDATIQFVGSAKRAAQSVHRPDMTLLTWATRQPPWLEGFAREHGLPIWRMEDGFLRSVQLGSDLSAPASLVLDRHGIYFDPRNPSELERILQETSFSAAELERARRLRERIVETRVSKYNVAGAAASEFRQLDASRPVVFVPGQVPDDLSVRFGSPELKSDQALLEAVRRLRPDAHLLYKPHPDVVSGNRRGEIPPAEAHLWDELVFDAPLHSCLDRASEVHTMTSLVGFEALMRGIPVTTHGQPFYSGWGLTTDQCPPARRTRRLTLDELVAGTLIRYPRYWSSRAAGFCEPEDIVTELCIQRNATKSGSLRAPWLLRKARSLITLAREWCRAL